MDITNTIQLPAPRGEVWRHLIEEEGLKAWLGAEHLDMDLFEDQTFTLEFEFEGELVQVAGEVALIIPPERFGLTWMEREGGRDKWRAPTRLLLDFETKGSATQLIIRHEGMNTVGTNFQQKAAARYQAYWTDQNRVAALQNMFI